jgi:glycosyltransferase involved in cell wall biosynthesis
MKVLIWQWGRRGGGPRYAIELADGMRALPGVEVILSLSAQSEFLRGSTPPHCEFPWPTYASLPGAVARLLTVPFRIGRLARRVRALAPDVALCAMPGMLDLEMAAALRRAGVPFFVVVHDAELHPGDGLPLQMTLQRMLARRADGLVAMSEHVAEQLRRGYDLGDRKLVLTDHPPRAFAGPPPPPRAHGGALRLLSFGRLLPYKGLDLLAEALRLLGPPPDLTVRVVGSGPESPVLDALRSLPGVTVENRWVPEDELGALIGWADALVLSHREASQSGGAAIAIAARRWVVATRVGGIAEQLRGETLARLCEPTAESLAPALRSLLDDPPPLSAPATDPREAWRATAARLLAQIGPAGLRAGPP